MNIENRATKLYLKKLPPVVAVELLEKYMIPSPYKEILEAVCIKQLPLYKAIEHLSNKHHINVSYTTIRRKVKIGLELFRYSNALDNNRYLS